MNKPGSRFLFITLSNIGDALLTTPVLQFLHEYDPRATIDIVGDERSSILFRHCPYRGEIYHKHKKRLLRGVPALLAALRRNHYDLVVDLRTAFLAYLIRAEQRFARSSRDGRLHAVEKHFSTIAGLAGARAIPPTALWLSRTERDYAAGICRQLPGQKWLCIGPGANWERKIWPAQNYAQTAAALGAEFDALALLGSGADNRHAQRIAQQAPLPCVNLCGQTTLLQAAAVLERMTLLLGNDSGLGHIAAALGTPSFTLFGPGQPTRYHPWGPHAAWHSAPDQVIESIPVSAVLAEVRTHLARISQSGAGSVV
ncbi:MAG: glycosyltransferase family 9 protein [Gammaproteobacteria bacterium]|nr:glycosyltransferase family 9 protein [Gammaproteobacteria bacterium]MCY4339716.1 glycosyltransferase family 9 protein [Gammaproteobacteria bacterium]